MRRCCPARWERAGQSLGRGVGTPIEWYAKTARDPQLPLVPDLPDKVEDFGFKPTITILYRGYENEPVQTAW